MGMVGEACLPSNAYYPRTPDYTLCSGVHVCWSEHSDSSFVYGFIILDYGFGTMTATTLLVSELLSFDYFFHTILKRAFTMLPYGKSCNVYKGKTACRVQKELLSVSEFMSFWVTSLWFGFVFIPSFCVSYE